MLSAIQVTAVPIPSCKLLGWLLHISLWVCPLSAHKTFVLYLRPSGPDPSGLEPSWLWAVLFATFLQSCSLAPQHRNLQLLTWAVEVGMIARKAPA